MWLVHAMPYATAASFELLACQMILRINARDGVQQFCKIQLLRILASSKLFKKKKKSATVNQIDRQRLGNPRCARY
jgi:hypothetical protein